MKFLKGLVVSILVIILFVSTLGLFILFPLKNAIGKNSIKEMVANIEVEKMMAEDPEFKEDINEMFKPVFDEAKEFGVDEEIIIKIIDSDEVKGLMGDFTSNIVDYVLTGQNQKILTTANIKELVTKAINDINASGIYEIDEKQKDSVLSSVEKYADEFENLIPNTQVIEEGLTKEDQEAIGIIRYILGNTLITYLIIASVISLLGLIFLKKKGAKWLKFGAITILISALISLITYEILIRASNILGQEEAFYITSIFNKGLNNGLMLSIIVAALMTITLIAYHVMLKRKALSAE